jgi:chorismate dehydratase
MSLLVGHIAYANCIPWFHFLRECGFDGEVIDGVPAELNRLLSTGKIDLCPSSSIEYALNSKDYLLLPGHSISSFGPIESVLLFSPASLSELNGVPIAISGESATSVALLQLLLKEFIRLDEVICYVPDVPVEEVIARGEPALLIGDRALKVSGRTTQAVENVIDLGALWYHFTNLPFVFALWIVRRNVAQIKSDEVNLFLHQLDDSRSKAFLNLHEAVQGSTEVTWMGEQRLLNYLHGVSYDLDPLHIEGLNCFYTLLEKHNLIETAPLLEFVPVDQVHASI